MYKRSIGGWAKHWDFILLDTICLQIAYIIAYSVRFGFHKFAYNRDTYRDVGLLLGAFSLIVAIVGNTMHSVLRRNIIEELKKTVIQCGLVFAAIVIFLFSAKDSDQVSRIILFTTLGIYVILSLTVRLIYKRILIRHKTLVKNREMLLVGDEAGIHKAITAFEAYPEESINITGLVLLDKKGINEIDGKVVVADGESAGQYIRNNWIDEVYIAVSDYSLMPDELIKQCGEMAVTVHQQMFINDDAKGRQWVEKIAKQPVLTTSIKIPRPRHLFIKRIVDIIAGVFLCLVSAIVIIIVTPIIKIASPGPIILKMEKIGQNGKKFRMYSIRVMYMDADRRLKEWKDKHGDKIPSLTSDPRFIGNRDGHTGIGVFIRRLGLDDLPKGLNILLGQMSLVGTRAPSQAEWERYEYRHRARLACKPGLTGLWQASGRSRTMSFEEATALDTEYIANWSLELDLKILFRTILKGMV